MPLLRIRTEIEDRPGPAGDADRGLAARGANILDLSVQVGTEGSWTSSWSTAATGRAG